MIFHCKVSLIISKSSLSANILCPNSPVLLLSSLSIECLNPFIGAFKSSNVSNAIPIIEMNADDRKSASYLAQIFFCLNSALFSKSSDIS